MTKTLHNLFFIFLSLSFVPSQSLLQPTDNSFISVLISQNGLDFVKDLLVTKAISSITPLQLPQIEKNLNIPLLGNVHVVVSNITIYRIDVPSSVAELGDAGVAIVASGTTCNLSMNWHYSYSTWLVPVTVSDTGSASVQVEGMEVGLTLDLENREGSLEVSLIDCGCYVKDISIMLDGGASWLYQGAIDAFGEQIGTAVEKAITKNLKDGVSKLSSFLQDLPKEIDVDDNASLNVTVDDLSLSNASIGFGINGLFTRRTEGFVNSYGRRSQLSPYCANPPKMIGIALDEAVFSSASSLYYNAEFMEWIVEKVPDQSLLNTAGWRFIIPQLYKKYPNHDMNMNISLSSPPVIKISLNNIDAAVNADLIIDVLDGDDVTPVACISLAISGYGSVKIVKNNIAGSVKLNDFSMQLKWSKVGNLRMFLIQPVIRTLLETAFLPYVNSHLAKGFPLPIIHGFSLYDAEIIFSDSVVTVCGNLAFEESYDLRHLIIPREGLSKWPIREDVTLLADV